MKSLYAILHMKISTLWQPCHNLVRLSQGCGILCKVFTTLQVVTSLHDGYKVVVQIVKLHSTGQ